MDQTMSCTMKRIAFFLFLLGTAAVCTAQNKGLVKWSDGLKDLSGYPVVDDAREDPSYSFFTFLKDRKTVRKDGISYVYNDVTAALRPAQSWVRSDAQTAATLAGIRRDFDLMEYFARQYRDALLTANDQDGTLQMDFTRQFQEVREQIRLGADPAPYALDPAPFDITRREWEQSRRSGGVTLAAYGMLPYGSLSHMLSRGLGATLGFERRWKRHSLLVDASAAFHPLTRHFDGLQGAWKNEKMTPSFVASLNYGVVVVSSRVIRMTLHAGPAFGGYLFTLGKSASEFVGGPGVTEGLSLDFILSRTMSFVSGSPEFADTAIRIKVFGGHFWSLQQQGLIFPTLNVGIGLHFDSRPLSRASRP